MKKKEAYSILFKNSFRQTFIARAIREFGSQRALAEYLNLRIKSRHVGREDIKNWKKGRHYFGYNLLIPIKIVKELCVINRTPFNSIFKEVIDFKPPWANPQKRELLVKGKKMEIIERKREKYIDVYSVLPEEMLPAARSKERLPLFAKKDRYGIELWSQASWKVSKIRLKKVLKLDELFFVGAAIYASEGLTKSDRDNSSIFLGNSEPAIINLFLKWMGSFLKRYEDYKIFFTVNYNGSNCVHKKIREFWNREIPFLDGSHQVEIRERTNYGSGLVNNFGVLRIRISNTVLKTFVLHLLNVAKKLALSKKEYATSYLKGLLASEGSVCGRSTLKQVTIGCLEKKERGFIKRLLKVMKLRFSEGKNHLVVTGWDSFLNLYKQDAFAIRQVNNASKKGHFLSGLKKHQKTQRLQKLQKFNGKEFTAKEWQKVYGLKRYTSAHKFLSRLVEENILSVHFKNNIKYYHINKKAESFLEFIFGIERL